MKAGVIIPCAHSPVRMPIDKSKLKKKEKDNIQFLYFHQKACGFFSIVDLANAFFNVPVHPNSQYWFAFTFQGKSYTFRRMSQGFVESPAVDSQVLHASLENLVLPAGSALIQYVDDLMICSPTKTGL